MAMVGRNQTVLGLAFESPAIGLLGLAAVHVVDPGVDRAIVVEDLTRLEEQAKFALGRLGAVGAVDQVEGVRDSEIAPDGARFRLGTKGRTHHLAADGDGIVATNGEDQHGAGGHELHEAGIEGTGFVRFVVGGRELLADPHQLGTDDLQALVFKPGDDAAHQVALDGVGLEDDQGRLHGESPANRTNLS
jgi:hypothetical protein